MTQYDITITTRTLTQNLLKLGEQRLGELEAREYAISIIVGQKAAGNTDVTSSDVDNEDIALTKFQK